MYSLKNLQKQEPLTINSLVFTENMDRAFTYLVLSDYDWMHYRLIAEFPVDNDIVMKTEFEYLGVTEAIMYISLDGHRFKKSFDSKIFEKHIKKYMEQHIKSWSDEYAFCGEEPVIGFFNEVLTDSSHTLETDKKHEIQIP